MSALSDDKIVKNLYDFREMSRDGRMVFTAYNLTPYVSGFLNQLMTSDNLCTASYEIKTRYILQCRCVCFV